VTRADGLRALAAVAVVGAVLGLEGYRLVEAPFEYVLWSDRDLLRAARLLVDWPSAGAELSYVEGGRVPGGFLYALWALPLALSPEPDGVWRLGVLLELAAAAIVGGVVARRAGAWAGALAASFQVASAASAETMLRLWNPGFVPAFAAAMVALAVVAAEGAGPATWLGLGLATSLGAQLHLGVLLLGLGLLVGLLAIGAPGRLRGVGACVAGVLLGYAPYVVAEARQGWPNTRSLLADAATSVPERHGVGEVASGLLHYLRLGGIGSAPGLGWTSLLLAGAAVAVATGLRRPRTAQGRVVGVLLLGVLAIPAFHLVEGKTALQRDWEGRYVIPAVSAVAVLVGLGWARLDAWARRRSGALAGVGVLAVSVSAVAAPLGVAALLPRPSVEGWAFQRDAIRAVHEDLGGTLADVAGRTVIGRNLGAGRWGFVAEQGIDAWLAREGAAFPGSRPGPCALVLQFGAYVFPDGVPDAALPGVLGLDLGGVRVLHQRALGPHLVVVYEPGAGACPTTLSNRYVELPTERVIRERWRTLAPDTAVEVDPPDPGTRRFVLRAVPPGSGAGLGLAVDVRVGAGGEVTATLHGNQLRGNAYNPGLLTNALLGHPRLELDDGARTIAVPFAHDLLGHRGVLAPVEATGALPPGRWRATFAAEALPVPAEGQPVDDAARAPFHVALGEVVVPP
jgi:hypothetical protein